MFRALVVLAVVLTSGCGFLDDEIAEEISSGFGLGISGSSGWGCGGSYSSRRSRAMVVLGDPDMDGIALMEASDPQVLAYLADVAQDGAYLQTPTTTARQSDPWLSAFVEAEKEVDTVLSSADFRSVPPAN